jgi:hypothetical protein
VESSQAVSCNDKEWLFESLGGFNRLLRDGYCDTHTFRGEGRNESGV